MYQTTTLWFVHVFTCTLKEKPLNYSWLVAEKVSHRNMEESSRVWHYGKTWRAVYWFGMISIICFFFCVRRCWVLKITSSFPLLMKIILNDGKFLNKARKWALSRFVRIRRWKSSAPQMDQNIFKILPRPVGEKKMKTQGGTRTSGVYIDYKHYIWSADSLTGWL